MAVRHDAASPVVRGVVGGLCGTFARFGDLAPTGRPHPVATAVLHVTVSFEGELRDHLEQAPPDGAVALELELPAGLRDVVQSLRVPHPECGVVTVNGDVRSWDSKVADGDEIAVSARYPLAEPPPDRRFLLDDHLGKLARHLRLLGLDVEHEPGVDDAGLARRSVADGRLLLTRDRGLLMRASLREGRFIRSIEPTQQAIEVLRAFALTTEVAPFTRCLECNAVLVTATLEEIADQIPASAANRYDRFRSCPGCRRVYWEGTHVDRLRERIRLILEGGAGS